MSSTMDPDVKKARSFLCFHCEESFTSAKGLSAHVDLLHNRLQAKPIKRIRRACDACSGKRVRCSGMTPCTRCSDLNVTCTYDRRPAIVPRRSAPATVPTSDSALAETSPVFVTRPSKPKKVPAPLRLAYLTDDNFSAASSDGELSPWFRLQLSQPEYEEDPMAAIPTPEWPSPFLGHYNEDFVIPLYNPQIEPYKMGYAWEYPMPSGRSTKRQSGFQ